MRRALALIGICGLFALAGCQAPSAAAGPGDPATDRIGWEEGYWYNDSVAVTSEDGLNATERDRVVARAMARVELLRGLEFEESVEVSVISREEFSSGTGDGTGTDGAVRTFDNAKFEALYLVGSQEDAVATRGETRDRTVAGFYSPGRGDIVIVSDARSPEFDGERTLAHELVHALQDQQFDLSRPTQRTRDAVNGHNGLIEGDARTVELAYTDRCGAIWDCLPRTDSGGSGDSGGDGDTRSSINLGLYVFSYFPYSDGPGFVSHLKEGENWTAVNEAFEAPPTTSTEVISPGLYGEFEPREVRLEDRTARGWTRVRPEGRPDHGRLGQAALTAMFAYTLYDDYNEESVVEPTAFLNLEGVSVNTTDPFNYSLAPTRGWTGDRLHVYRNGDRRGYVWRLTWASPAAAERFAERYRALLEHWGGTDLGDGVWRVEPDSPFAGAVRVDVEGDTVTVVGAPGTEALEGVRRGER